MQQILLVANRIGLGVGVGQPVVAGDRDRTAAGRLRRGSGLHRGSCRRASPGGADEVGQLVELWGKAEPLIVARVSAWPAEIAGRLDSQDDLAGRGKATRAGAGCGAASTPRRLSRRRRTAWKRASGWRGRSSVMRSSAEIAPSPAPAPARPGRWLRRRRRVTSSTDGRCSRHGDSTSSCIFRRVRASRATSGSSSSSRAGSRTRAQARAVRWASPPDRVAGQASRRWPRPPRSTPPRRGRGHCRPSAPGRHCARPSSTAAGGRPGTRPARASGVVTSWPPTRSRPARVRSSVVLPEPLASAGDELAGRDRQVRPVDHHVVAEPAGEAVQGDRRRLRRRLHRGDDAGYGYGVGPWSLLHEAGTPRQRLALQQADEASAAGRAGRRRAGRRR